MSIPIYIPSEEKVVHYTSVDFAARYINAPVHLVQYDNGLPIIAVSLYLNGIPYEIPSAIDTANVRVAKTDNKYVYNPVLGTNNERNVLYVEVTRQMVAAYGDEHPILELVKYGSEIDEIVASGSFHVIVDPNPVRDTNIESSSEYKSAKEFAILSQSYAVGGTGTREGEDINNSEYFSRTAQAYMELSSSNMNIAGMHATEALIASDNALTYKENAEASAAEAATHASNASESETNAATHASNASESETNAKAYEELSLANAETSTNMANLAKSYAVGDTGVREDEDTDNSKWYAEQAKASETFVTEVSDKAKEYEELAKSYAVGNTGVREDENTDNAKYYSESAKTSEENAAISANTANESAESAIGSAAEASESADAAKTEAETSTAYSVISKSYAVGGTGTREDEDEDNAKYYYEQTKSISHVEKASTETLGIVKIPTDGTITIDPDGTIHASAAVTIDPELDETSPNAIANSAVANAISKISDDVANNTSNIETNTADIATNASNIAANTANIADNASKIATNTSNIAANTTNIADNASKIATNTANIADNASKIATNTANIAANTASISSHATSISTLNNKTKNLDDSGKIDYANVKGTPTITDTKVTSAGAILTSITASTADISAGSTPLATGQLYVVYE